MDAHLSVERIKTCVSGTGELTVIGVKDLHAVFLIDLESTTLANRQQATMVATGHLGREISDAGSEQSGKCLALFRGIGRYGEANTL